jgi:hypothetical protein
MMGLSASLFLIAVGAILAFAVHVHTTGFDVNTIGVILMVIGILGMLISLLFWSSWGGFHHRRTVVLDREPRRHVVEDY